MEHRDVFVLEIIIEYCDKILEYISELAITEQTFMEMPRCQDLCAFYCIQIGENAKTLSDKFIATHSEIEWYKIVAFRNNIVHEYGSMDPKYLWDVVSNDIPKLHNYCAKTIRA